MDEREREVNEEREQIAPKNSNTQAGNVKSQSERNGEQNREGKNKRMGMEMQIEIYLICVFLFLVARLTANHHNQCQLLEKYYNRKMAWFLPLSSFSDSLAPAFYWLDRILNFHIGYDASATRHWIESRNRLNTIRHRYICIVAKEKLRWIKHKWARDCHKNQSLETTHTHARTLCSLGAIFAALDIWLSFYQFDHLHILSIFVNLKIAEEKSVYSRPSVYSFRCWR